MSLLTKSFLFLGVFSIFHLHAQPEFKSHVYKRTSATIQKDFPKKHTYDNKDLIRKKLLFSIYELQCTGNYKNSLAKYDSAGSTADFSFVDSLNHFADAKNYSPVDAKNYILTKAKTNRIVIINEIHDQPMHRVFVSSLLKELYAQGFHYLAVEALNSDSSLNQKNKPVMDDGYYTIEPQFSNMLKEAQELGFHFVDYEARNPEEFKKREYYQAKHIKEKTIDKDPAAKVIVYCGFGHVSEKSYTDSAYFMMAAWLKIMTKIDPLTIDQETLTEHSGKDFESTSYSFFNVPRCSVFMNKDSTQPFIPFDGEPQCDIYVYHPRTKYIDKRPDWLVKKSDVHEYFIPKEKVSIKYPLIIMAYSTGETFDHNLPSDAIELKNSKDAKPLVLKSGMYNLLLRNDLKQEQTIEIQIK